MHGDSARYPDISPTDISPTDTSPTDISPTDISPTDISSKSPRRTFRQPYIFSSKLRSYYHKPHDNDSTKVLYNKISNTLVLCRCISLESSCTTYIWTMPPYLLRVASIVPHWLNLFIGSPLGSNRLVLCRCITFESSSECLARLG